MGADANIFQAYLNAPKSALDYQAQYNQADAARVALQKSQMDLSNAADVNRQRNALRDAVTSGQVDLSNPDHVSRILSLAPDVAPAMLKTVQEGATSRAKAGLDTAQAGEAVAKTTASQLDQVIKAHDFQIQKLGAVNDPQSAKQWAIDGLKSGVFTPEQFAQGFTNIPADPAQFAAWKQQAMQGGTTATEQLKMQQAKLIADNINQTHIQTTGMTNATSRENNKANITKDYALAGLDANGKDAGGGTGGLTPAAIENAAARYNQDGTLPPQLGRGTQGARDIRAIQNRAAEITMGTDPTQIRINQIDNKAGAGALNNLTKAQTMAASFERTANANADLALGLSKQLDRTGVPILNAGIQAWRTGTGSPEATQFAAANETFVNEYAKIMSGGMGNGPVSDSARAKAHTLLTTAMTPQQYEGNVKLLQTEMGNRMKGFEDQATALRAKMGGKSAPDSAASSGVPPDIAAILQKHGGK